MGNRFSNIVSLLQAALPFWPRARYSSARYGGRSDMDNKPTDQDGLKKAVEDVLLALDKEDDLVKKPPVKKEYKPKPPVHGETQPLAKEAAAHCPCGNPAARACVAHLCNRCCSGPCVRHRRQETNLGKGR